MSGNKILTSIKGHNSVANLQKKMTLYNTNVDLVYSNVYTTFGSILSIHFQDIEKKLNYDEITELQNDRRTDRTDPVKPPLFQSGLYLDIRYRAGYLVIWATQAEFLKLHIASLCTSR